jgi:hypothetical protein
MECRSPISDVGRCESGAASRTPAPRLDLPPTRPPKFAERSGEGRTAAGKVAERCHGPRSGAPDSAERFNGRKLCASSSAKAVASEWSSIRLRGAGARRRENEDLAGELGQTRAEPRRPERRHGASMRAPARDARCMISRSAVTSGTFSRAASQTYRASAARSPVISTTVRAARTTRGPMVTRRRTAR